MIKAIIFDMDGLMFNTEPLWDEAFVKTIKKLGYSASPKLHHKIIGTNGKTTEQILKKDLGPNFPFQKFNNLYFDIMKQLINEKGIELKKGLIELLNYLTQNSYKIAIASSSRMDIINTNLKKANLNKNIFDVIVSGDDLKDSKPNPEIFLKTCKSLNTKPENTIVLEDSNSGIKAAYNAGCIPILIPDLDKIKPETLNMKKHKLTSLLEVIDLLEKEN